MLQPLIDRILKSADVQSVVVDDNEYFDRSLVLPPSEPLAKPIQISTLTGFTDYILNDIDEAAADFHIEIVSPTRVALRDQVEGRHRQRQTAIIADCSEMLTQFPCDRYLSTDEAVIKLMTAFKGEGDLAALLSHVGTLSLESSLEVDDDGTTQKTVNTVGIRKKAEGKLENPITLTPYRTFAEIEQPSSPYVYRLKRGREEIQFALFESGDQTWQLEAIALIKEQLQQLLADSGYSEMPILA